MQIKNRLTVLFSVLMLVSLGCSFIGQLFGSPGSGKREVSHEPPTLSAPPNPLSAPQGTPDEQAVYFAEQLASGKDHLAVWMGLYDVLGIPLIGQDGSPLGKTGDDPVGPRFWQVWYSSGLDLPGRGIPLQDAGRLIAAGLPDMDGADIGQVLLDDLRLAAQSNDPRVRLMGLFVRERILRGPSHVDILDAAVTPDSAVIDVPTLQLLCWIILRNALFRAASQASVPGDSITLVDYYPRSAAQLGPQLNCSDLPGAGSDAAAWHNWAINKAGGGFQLPGMTEEIAFPSLVERIVGKVASGSADKIERITKLSGQILGFANVFTSAISLILQLESMTIDAHIDPDPLIRTHYTSDGNGGTITLELYSDSQSIPDGNELESCMSSYFLNALGVSFAFPSKGPIPGAEVKVEGGKGFPDLVLFDINGETGKAQTQRKDTGKDGKVTFNVLGRHQKKTIPDSAPSIDKEFSIIVSAQPEESGLGSMANIFYGGLGGLSGGAAFLSSLIDVLKTFRYDMGEYVLNLTDWTTTGWKLEGWKETSFSTVLITGGLSCDSPYGPWEFSSEGSTSQGGTGSSTFKVPFSEDGNATATHNEHVTLPIAEMVGDYNGTPKVTIIPVPGGYRMDFGPDHMTGSTCVKNNPCQPYDTVKKAWSTNIVPADPGECPP